MRIRLKILILTSILVALYAMYYWGLPAIVNIGKNFEPLSRYVKNEFGFVLKSDNPKLKMGLSPSVWLSADSFSVSNHDNSDAIKVVSPKIKIELLPLLIGRLKIDYFYANNLVVNLKVDKNSRWYLGQYPLIDVSAPKLGYGQSNIILNSYLVNLNDELTGKNLSVKGDYFVLNEFDPQKVINVKTAGKLLNGNWASDFSVDLDTKLPIKRMLASANPNINFTLTGVRLSDYSNYIKILTKDYILSSAGDLNVYISTKKLSDKKSVLSSEVLLSNLDIKQKEECVSIRHKGKLSFVSESVIQNNKLLLNYGKLIGHNINCRFSGEILKLNSKMPILDLDIAVNKSRIEDFIDLLPAHKIMCDDVNIFKLKKFGFYSDISGNLEVKGIASQPEIYGKIISSNAYVVSPLPPTTPKATIKISFIGKKLELDVVVPASRTEKVFVTGNIELYNDKIAELYIKSTENVDLETAQTVLTPIHQIFDFELGPVPIMKLKGLGNIDIKVTGNKVDPHIWGDFNFRNAIASFNDINNLVLNNASGKLKFDNYDTHFLTNSANIKGKPVVIDGTCNLFGELDFDVTAQKQDIGDLLLALKTSPMLKDLEPMTAPIKTASGNCDFLLNLTGKVLKIEDFVLGKTVNSRGSIKLYNDSIYLVDFNKPIEKTSGVINFKDFETDFKLTSYVDKSKIDINGKTYDDKLVADVKSNKFYLSDGLNFLNSSKSDILKPNLTVNKKNNNVYAKFNATYAGSFKEINPDGLRLNADVDLANSEFVYTPLNMPIKIISGGAKLKDGLLVLSEINTTLDKMPMLLYGKIFNLYTNPQYNITINSKPTQDFIDKYLNRKAIYPIKVKGDLIYNATLKGNTKFCNVSAEANLEENSSIYYMGSTIGDANNPIKILFNGDIYPNKVKINNMRYEKMILSQNNKYYSSPQVMLNGLISFASDNIYFNEFKIKTFNPTDAKIFNIIFKKPLMKQGLFSSDLVINGSVKAPSIRGKLSLSGADIPFLDTIIKNISLDFQNKNILVDSSGEIFSNAFKLNGAIKNKLYPPYVIENLKLDVADLDLNAINDSLKRRDIMSTAPLRTESKETIDLSSIIVNKFEVNSDKVTVRNIRADDFYAKAQVSDKMVASVDKFTFKIAEGTAEGGLNFNLLSNILKFNINVNDINANLMTEALFDLPNQIYGSLNGSANLMCNGKTHKTCMSTLTGTSGFKVTDGKMPKLGSLEYLLKAGNLLKSGVTGLTINSIIDIITPLKTGDFETIQGTISIDDGVAESIQIYSKGKDLSLFITGKYNFSTLVADMHVLGRLSKNISTVLGAVGNASLNTLLNTIPGVDLTKTHTTVLNDINKIPGLELSGKTYRIFAVEIFGDINQNNYVKSFRWVE